jgi:hypothetical protein
MLGTGSAGRAPSKIEKLRQTLAALLPSQEDASLIAESTNGWVLLSVLCTPANDLYRNSDPTSSFNVVAVSQRGPTIIARTLLYIAICIQQLPPEFDTSRLQLKNFSVDALMDKYMSTVASLVTSNDELAGTMEGLECILLQGLFHINSGNLRRAWLSFRRGLTIAQLLGLQKAYLKPLDEVDLMTVMAMKMMWHKVIQSDRYLGVILGLPCGTGDDCFGDEEESLQGLNADNRDVFERRLCIIAGSINARNLKESSTKTYTVTQQLDEKMDRLSNEMSQSWWEIPVLAVVERSLAVSGQFDRLLAQLWFFQLKALLHLPFMLCAGTDRRYEYSKFSCLNASRELVLRYLALRRFGNTQLMCRVVDFAAFIGAIILILDQVGPPSPEAESPKTQQLRESDRSLIQNVITSMETVSHSNREVAARESVEVMKTLLASNTTSRNLRLTIPYFGTIRLLREQIPSQTSPNPEHLISSTLNAPQHPDVYGQNIEVEDWQGSQSVQNYRNIPVVSFESSQFASFDIDPSTENWDFADADQLIFNSLLNMDIGGDWIS